MRRPLVLTGAPAAGKTTCGRRLAESRELAAFVDVDDIRQLVVAGSAAPWDGADGERQQLLGAENAIALARGFVAAGVEVVVADVLVEATLRAWLAAGLDALVVHLRVSETEARRRAESRPRWISDDEFAGLHRIERDHPPAAAAAAVLDVDELTLDQQVAALERIWTAGQRLPARRTRAG